MSVPAPPKQPTPPPSKPTKPSIPTTAPSMPKQPKLNIKAKIKSKPSLPPSIPSVPEQPPQEPPNKPQIPLPRPKTPKTKPKTYNLGMMPQAILSPGPSLPAPAIPSNRDKISTPSLPSEVRPKQKPKSFSSAMNPPKPKASSPFFPPPNVPQQPLIPTIPTTPTTPTKPVRISAQAAMPPDIAPPAPRTPSYSEPRLPSPRHPIPQSQTHNLGVMPASVVDEKQSISFAPPSVPQEPLKNILPSIPQEPKPKVSVSAAAMAPPSIPSPKVITPPPMPQQPATTDTPMPENKEEVIMESLKSGVQSNNEVKPKPKKKKSMAKKKKKSKKVKKERDTMEEQKQHLTVFFTTYSDSKNWEESDAKHNGVTRYILKFANRDPLNARMAFLYSMTLYLGQIVGVNKRCISHAFMLFKSVRAQIDTLSEEFALILQTLEHHNDDKLWKYVYSFLYNAAAYFKHIQRFVGTRTSVTNSKKYARDLKSHSRDYTNTHTLNRRESSFRKLSGLSEVSGQSFADFNDQNSNISAMSNKTSERMVYGNSGDDMGLNDNNSASKNKKSNKKKKKSSYA